MTMIMITITINIIVITGILLTFATSVDTEAKSSSVTGSSEPYETRLS